MTKQEVEQWWLQDHINTKLNNFARTAESNANKKERLENKRGCSGKRTRSRQVDFLLNHLITKKFHFHVIAKNGVKVEISYKKFY